MIDKLIWLALVTSTICLSGSASSSFCHCDLTPSFCDVSCCCDSDCSSNTVADCYYLKSNSYCPDPTFFARLGTTYLNSQGCFYYNSTDSIVEEVSVSSRITTQIVSQQKEVQRVNASLAPQQGGYQQGDILSISNSTSSLPFVSNSGQCLLTASSSQAVFNIRFGLNTKIVCKNSSTTIPLLFSTISGASIGQFPGETSRTIKLPTIDQSITDVQINFIIGTYGSSRIKYIERITSSFSSTSPSTRSLNLNFLQPSQIGQLTSSPSFFPQIPKDMFYPIYLLS